jgi:glycosyltransferase involved in cell wall biosynthesis
LNVGNRFLWLAVGSFRDESKDYATLLRAVASMGIQAPEPLVLIASGGDLFEEKNALAASLGVGEHVCFLGLRSDVSMLLRGADGYVMSFLGRRCRSSLWRASASGLPAVVTRVGENASIVEDGVTGFVVPAQGPFALAGAMQRLAALPEAERLRLGLAPRARTERMFDLDAAVERWERLYQRLLR